MLLFWNLLNSFYSNILLQTWEYEIFEKSWNENIYLLKLKCEKDCNYPQLNDWLVGLWIVWSCLGIHKHESWSPLGGKLDVTFLCFIFFKPISSILHFFLWLSFVFPFVMASCLFQSLHSSLNLFIKSSSTWFKQHTNACINFQELHLS